MKFLKKLFKRGIGLIFPVFCAAVLTFPILANAQTATTTPGSGTGGGFWSGLISGVLGATIGWVVFVINYIIAAIAGLGISIVAWFISVVLQLNTNLVNSMIVQKGFSITLALANLGFVLAIIVIAIMTILRYESYALKQTLWKLVAAAILVNFSLVIAGAILNFSDQLTFFFLDSWDPGSNSGSTLNNYDNFATGLAGAFAPQRVFLNLTYQGQRVGAGNMDSFKGVGQTFGETLMTIMNLFFSTIFLIVAVIALAGLFIMLLIRYIYLGILLILMPMAWLFWIFPITAGQWTKWWSKFIQWTMFAPVVMFFLYLAMLTLGSAATAQRTNDPYILGALGITQSPDNQMVAAVANSLGGGFIDGFGSTFLQGLLQMAMMVSLVFAGLFMASSMGITFANITTNTAKGAVKGFGSWVKTKGAGGGARAATGTLSTAHPTAHTGIGRILNPINRARNLVNQGINRVGAPVRAVVGRIPGAAAVGATVAAYGATAAASPGLLNSIWTGAKNGSGLFNKVKNWTCQNCRAFAISSPTRPVPDAVCGNCGVSTNIMRLRPGVSPTYENWA